MSTGVETSTTRCHRSYTTTAPTPPWLLHHRSYSTGSPRKTHHDVHLENHRRMTPPPGRDQVSGLGDLDPLPVTRSPDSDPLPVTRSPDLDPLLCAQ
ncbi:unnamed protein product [Merluccius merluccius]